MTSKETKRNVGVMKKARLLVLCLILMIMMILSGCSITSGDISLDDISIDDGMKVTATVNIKNIDLENFREGTDNTLSFITVVYAYTQDKITALEADDEYVGKNPGNCPTTPIPTGIYDGTEDFQVSEEDVAAFKDGTETSYSKQLEFPIPEAAKGKKVDFFVVLTGKDDGMEGRASSGIFTFIPAPTVTAPTPKTLTYNGSAQELVYDGNAQALVVPGEVIGGKMFYALGSDNVTAPVDGWSETVPTATEPGTYYVWYKVEGDENHNDVAPVCVVVTIEKKAEATPAATVSTSDFTLLATLKTSGKKALKLSWTAVAGAEGYDVFFGRSSEAAGQYLTSVTGQKYTVKKLLQGIGYRASVQAWRTVNGQKTYIGQPSPDVFAVTNGKTAVNFTNPKKISVKKKKMALNVGGTKAIKASVKKAVAGRKYLNKVAKVRYFSSDRRVATVDAKGNITAVGAGTCTVFAMAENGLRVGVNVTVK